MTKKYNEKFKELIEIKKNQLIICSSNFEIKNLDEIKIMPLGVVETTKGNFFVDEDSVNKMKSYFDKRGLDIVVDYEHQSLSDKKAIAGGWIKDFYVKDNSVVAKVEWTEQAKKEIENKQYRYLSPTIFLKNGKPVRLHSVALTNTPAIDKMFPLSLSEDLEDELGEEILEIEKILEILGLDINSSEEEVLQKLRELKSSVEQLSQNKEVIEILELKETATTLEIKEALIELKNNTVSKEEFLKLKNEIEEKEIDIIIDDALREGKIIPAQLDSFKKLALSDRAIFDEVLKNQSKVSPIGINYSNNLPKNGAEELGETALKACKDFGLSKEDYEKYYKGDE